MLTLHIFKIRTPLEFLDLQELHTLITLNKQWALKKAHYEKLYMCFNKSSHTKINQHFFLKNKRLQFFSYLKGGAKRSARQRWRQGKAETESTCQLSHYVPAELILGPLKPRVWTVIGLPRGGQGPKSLCNRRLPRRVDVSWSQKWNCTITQVLQHATRTSPLAPWPLHQTPAPKLVF